MKRALTYLIHAFWLVFFAFHAFGALTGSLTLEGLGGSESNAVVGPLDLPLLHAGLGNATLVATALFLWAFLNGLFGNEAEMVDGEVDTLAFAGGTLVFLALASIALVQTKPELLLASTSYFAAIIVSWSAIRLELARNTATGAETSDNDTSAAFARSMAKAASHPHRIAYLAKRDRT